MAEEKQMIRILNVDIVGSKPIYYALTKIRGIGYSVSNAVCSKLGIDKSKRIGTLSPDEVKKIEDIIKSEGKLPSFLMNRRKDRDSGKDRHITGTDIAFMKAFDIKRFKTIKSYKGIRHALGLPVRGQSTEHHFRHGKTIGVKKKGLVPAPAKEKEKK